MKKDMSETQFKGLMGNVSNAAGKMTTSCFSPYADLLLGICDFAMSM